MQLDREILSVSRSFRGIKGGVNASAAALLLGKCKKASRTSQKYAIALEVSMSTTDDFVGDTVVVIVGR